MAALVVVYFIAGKLGLTLAFVNASATAVWPPTGIALVSLLVLGYRAWPAILLGAFLVNVTTAGSVATSIGIAVGNTLEALAGAYLVNRFANGRSAFDKVRDIFRFAFLAAVGSTTVSATLGVTTLWLGGFARSASYGSIWLTWWLGDMTADLVLAPALLLWSRRVRPLWTRERAFEVLCFLLSFSAVAALVFCGFFPTENKNYPLEFLCIPLLVWAAFRLGQREAASTTLALSAVAVYGTLRGLGPFKGETQNESLLLLQAFMGVIAITTAALAAVVAERKRIAESLGLLESAVDGAIEGVIILAAESGRSEPRMTFVNGGFTRLTGLASSEVLGETLEVLPVSENDREMALQQRLAMGAGQRSCWEQRTRRPDGTEYALELEFTPVPKGATRPTHWVGVLRDVTERRVQFATLEHQALYDFLTGLPNRILLCDRLDQAILGGEREGSALALFVMDLDRFKEINDILGHAAGDVLLKQIGARLRGGLRTVDTVARLGGDEFGILLPGVGDHASAIRMAEKIVRELETPFVVDGNSLVVSASVGIAICPEHGRDWTTLTRNADAAMYAAKKSSRRFAVYSPGEDAAGGSSLSLMKELREGIGGDDLHLRYQPLADLKSRRVIDVEALVRWQHPRRGLMLSEEFLPAAERTGLTQPLFEWALATALGHCREWLEAGLPLHVALNVSDRVLRDPVLAERITGLLKRLRLEPDRLKLEVTEGSIIADPRRALSALTRIRDSGVQLSIDDFGAGQSSLSSLKQLPVDEIKIHKSFVRQMANDPKDAAIVGSAIDLGHRLGRRVVAQGVEDGETWSMLAALGCDLAQGRYVSPPMPPGKVAVWLEQSPGNWQASEGPTGI